MSQPALLRVPLFPLPGVVLFPGAILPLRVFEPRYLRLLGDALASDKLIGMPQIKPAPQHFSSEEAIPDLHGIMGIGQVIAHEQLSDGTFQIALLGQGRYRIETEVPHQPYRIAQASPLPDHLPQTTLQRQSLTALSGELFRSAETLIGRTLDAESRAHLLDALQERNEPGAISDLLASIFVQDSSLRQALLESADVLARTRLVHAVIHKLLDRVQNKPITKAGGEDICLN